MIAALFLALREGLEAALIVGVVLVYLDKAGRAALSRYVWAGTGLAVLGSIGVGALLQRWRISEDGYEGILMLVAAVLVVTMIFWMNRVARTLRTEIEQRVDSLSRRGDTAAAFGLGFFVFLMVIREGAEIVLILRAVEFSSEGVSVWIGTGCGLALAVIVGLLFFKGTLRIPLHKFFAVTTTILIVVAFQLALTGVHELSEAMWIASSRQEMAWIGPIVRNEVFFFVAILGVAGLAILREVLASSPKSQVAAANSAERRRLDWERRKQRRWAFAGAFGFLGIILLLAAEFVYARAAAQPADATKLTIQNNFVTIPLAQLTDSNLHFYSVTLNGTTVRFLVIHKRNGEYATALDACEICGAKGYRQQGDNIICRNCAAAIYAPSIGESGGCNPIPVSSQVVGDMVKVDLSALARATAQIHP